MLFGDEGAGTDAAVRDAVVLDILAAVAAHAAGASSVVPAMLHSVRYPHTRTRQSRVVVETASERDQPAVFAVFCSLVGKEFRRFWQAVVFWVCEMRRRLVTVADFACHCGRLDEIVSPN